MTKKHHDPQKTTASDDVGSTYGPTDDSDDAVLRTLNRGKKNTRPQDRNDQKTDCDDDDDDGAVIGKINGGASDDTNGEQNRTN